MCKYIASTLDNTNGNGSIKQHIFKARKEYKDYWKEELVDGNISLCGNISGRNIKEKPLPLLKMDAEELKEDCCKKCLSIYKKITKVYL